MYLKFKILLETKDGILRTNVSLYANLNYFVSSIFEMKMS